MKKECGNCNYFHPDELIDPNLHFGFCAFGEETITSTDYCEEYQPKYNLCEDCKFNEERDNYCNLLKVFGMKFCSKWGGKND